jgi:Regulator of G protein signaling domain
MAFTSTCGMTSAQLIVFIPSRSLFTLDLDLWLDIKQHTSLCRVYVRELRRSVLVATPDVEKETEHHRSTPETDPQSSYNYDDEQEKLSQYYDRPPHAGGGQIGDHNISPFLRSQSQQGFHQQQQSGSKTPPPLKNYPTSHDSPESHGSNRNRTVNRGDLRAAAEKILTTYLLPGSQKECVLPREMVLDIQNAIEKDGRDDPEIFDAAREYIFQAMERQVFPGFLRAKALGNIVRLSALFRLILGLLSLFAGFWAGFAMIFLAYSRVTRCWVFSQSCFINYSLSSHLRLVCTSYVHINIISTHSLHWWDTRNLNS